jgi:hypothetical protein
MRKVLLSVFTILSLSFFLICQADAQTYNLKGNVKSAETSDIVANATVTLSPGTSIRTTDSYGNFIFEKLSTGIYIIKVNFVGYEIYTQEVNLNSDIELKISLKAGGVVTEVIEINRAKDRVTPVAFTDVDKFKLETKMSGQDAPLLVRGTPGMYAYSTDGVGNGEGVLLVRGFTQNYVQVLVNGIPTNDPESNAVYWSNWGAVSNNAGSIQIQRGAGSSLYGAGSFGGSFNILTEGTLYLPTAL